MMDSGYSITDYQLCAALIPAVGASRQELVTELLKRGAWAQWARVSHPAWEFTRFFKVGREDSAHDDWFNTRKPTHPLVVAAGNGDVEMCSLLLSQPQGVPVLVAREALCAAAHWGNIPVAQLLIDKVPAVRYTCTSSRNPLAPAAYNGGIETVQFFLGQGADPLNREGTPFSGDEYDDWPCSQPLEAAASDWLLDTLQLLLDAIPQWEGHERQWVFALASAASNGQLGATRLLLSRQPGNLVWSELPQEYPLCGAARKSSTKTTQALLEHGMPESHIQEALETVAICYEFTGVVQLNAARYNTMQLLIQYGAPMDKALFAAVYHDIDQVSQWFLKQGAAASTAALAHAAKYRASKCLQLLLQKGAQDEQHWALFQAARRGWVKGMQVLASAGLPTAPDQAKVEVVNILEVALCGAASTGQKQLIVPLLDCLTVAADSNTSATDLLASLQYFPDKHDSTGSSSKGGAGSSSSSSTTTTTSTSYSVAHLNKAMAAAAAGWAVCHQHPHLSWWDAEWEQCEQCQCAHDAKFAKRHQGISAVAQLLMDKGADPSLDNGRWLLSAINNNSNEVLDVLLESSPQHTTITSGAALWEALEANNCYAVDQLLPLTDLDEAEYTEALEYAAYNGFGDAVCSLLARYGPESELQAKYARGILHIAIEQGDAGIAASLLYRGAQVNEVEREALWAMAADPDESDEARGLVYALEFANIPPPQG
jgi:ankyrin repeat protein